jgi:hypothetical protein
MLNGYISANVELNKTLNYQVPNVSGQQILDIIPSQNSQFALVSKPNGVVQLHSTTLNMSDLKQIIMFSNDGDKMNNLHNSTMKKLKLREVDRIKCNKSILNKSQEIKYLAQVFGKAEKAKKQKSKSKDTNGDVSSLGS